MAFRKWSKKNSSATLSDIIRGIQFCINSSIEILEQHFSNQIDKYIDSEDKLISKSIRINDKYAVDIPLFCLSDHNALMLDEMEVKMKVNLKDFEIKEIENTYNEENFSISRSSFCVDSNNINNDDPNNIDICMKFKSANPPEAISIISEKLLNTINTYNVK